MLDELSDSDLGGCAILITSPSKSSIIGIFNPCFRKYMFASLILPWRTRVRYFCIFWACLSWATIPFNKSPKNLSLLACDCSDCNAPFALLALDEDDDDDLLDIFFAGELFETLQSKSPTTPLISSMPDCEPQSSETLGEAGGVTTGGDIIIGPFAFAFEDLGAPTATAPFTGTFDDFDANHAGSTQAGKGASHPLPLGEAGGVTTGRNIIGAFAFEDLGPPIATAPFAPGTPLI